MNVKFKLYLFFLATTSITFGLLGAIGWLMFSGLSNAEKIVVESLLTRHFVFLFLGAIILLFAIGFACIWYFYKYLNPVQKLLEETKIIFSANPDHKINPEGASDVKALAETINKYAASFWNLQKDIGNKIDIAKRQVEEEKNTLAALVSEVQEGVIVCNADYRIILYNKQAKNLLGPTNNSNHQTQTTGKFLGLGRSIFGLLNKNLLVHALEDLTDRLNRNLSIDSSSFVTSRGSNRLLQIQVVPILSKQVFDGMVLLLENITHKVEKERRRDYHLLEFRENARSSLTGIRAAVESITAFPKMKSDKKQQLMDVIQKEAIALSIKLDEAEKAFSDQSRTHWYMNDILVTDIFPILGRRAQEKLQLELEMNEPDNSGNLWIRCDSYAIILSVLFLLKKLQNQTNENKFHLNVQSTKKFINIDLCWAGSAIPAAMLHEWEEQALMLGGEGEAFTLKEVLDHHGAAAWSKSHRRRNNAYLRILLPAVRVGTAGQVQTAAPIRPSETIRFYDFDLFNQPGQNSELDHTPLDELSYTVFDTETTGPSPSLGDEIISIGAVRIINKKLLVEESFDQLIDPQRPIRPESMRFHGIQPEMLQGQPTALSVVPQFHEYCEDTILVSHNAAFDMRLLEMKEKQTGVKFINPVLDTLLLSAVLHPNRESHSLEAAAELFGVKVMGRHTALGDALATAEIFLKLISLLREMGIHTLKQAREASQKTYYSRLAY